MRLTVAFVTFLVSMRAASLSGIVTDPQAKPVAGATVTVGEQKTTTDGNGSYRFNSIADGTFRVLFEDANFEPESRTVRIAGDVHLDVQLTHLARRAASVTVTADVNESSLEHPDPGQRVLVREEILDANPGRPGAPVSIPGLPIETASGGIKAPQYFAPGVAGDHGEPIAQFLVVGSYLLPNNLSANAHGNGYSDPNIMVPEIIEGVETDGGAFNVREGNHSVDLAASYEFHERLNSFLTLTGDQRDIDLAGGWSPANPATKAWITLELSYGNGFLNTLEHRQQYKVNGDRVYNLGHHVLTLFGIGYYGSSRVPGLVPIDQPDPTNTIDPRQKDQTHTGELAINDVWHDLQLSGFFRSYNLALFSNFGDGLIRQSEFRTENGENAAYTHKFSKRLSILAGVDHLREAPRRDDLDHYLSTNPALYGPFVQVTANNIAINLISPFVAIDGELIPWLHYDLGWRRDQVDFDNTDLLTPANSFYRWTGFNSPKATLSLQPPGALPSVAASFGEAFFTNDPRIGSGSGPGTLVSRTHSYQMVISKTVAKTDLRITLGRTTQEASLAKIDPDTGLQYDEGPSRNRYVTASARRYFHFGLLEASVSKADARDLSDGLPVPEAPRLIVDFLGTIDKLPFGLHVRAEFEDVGAKPLGDGFTGVPVREFRAALLRRFLDDRLSAGVNFQLASGYTGQTTEVIDGVEQITGVYLPSYASLSFSYRFR